ncbi:MAG: hypothetical protein AAF567_10950 [Actinomycetota bacterium]
MGPNARRARWFYGGFAALMLALAVSGVVMMFTRRPDRGVTFVANRGRSVQPGGLGPLQDLHESLAALTVIGVGIGGAWLMLRVKQDWLGAVGVAFVFAGVAVFTGLLLQYEALGIGGLFVEDVQGYSFLFDPDFDVAVFGSRELGANWYRFWFVVHLGGAAGSVVAVWRSMKDLDVHGRDIWAEGRRRRGPAVTASAERIAERARSNGASR